MVATWPLTLTQPLAIQSSASRREHRPRSAMRLFRRTVSVGPATRVRVPAGAGARRMAPEGPEAGEAGTTGVRAGGFCIVIDYYFCSYQ
jgi:hypothetical protein